MNLFKRKPSGAMIVAVIALVFAMVGGAIAAKPVTKSKVKSIVDNKIEKAEPGLNVNSAKTADNATNATNATNAANATTTGGQTITKIFTTVPDGGGATTALQVNGLTLTMTSCGAGTMAVDATTSVDNSLIQSSGTLSGTAFGGRSSDFDSGDSFDVLDGEGRGNGTVNYMRPDGRYVAVSFGADDPTTLGGQNICAINGSAISG